VVHLLKHAVFQTLILVMRKTNIISVLLLCNLIVHVIHYTRAKLHDSSLACIGLQTQNCVKQSRIHSLLADLFLVV